MKKILWLTPGSGLRIENFLAYLFSKLRVIALSRHTPLHQLLLASIRVLSSN